MRDRRQERREDRREDRGRGAPGAPGGPGGAAAGGTVYQMREKLASIGDDFWIETNGQRAFKVDGKAVRVRDTLAIRNAQGVEVARLQERMIDHLRVVEIGRRRHEILQLTPFSGKPKASADGMWCG